MEDLENMPEEGYEFADINEPRKRKGKSEEPEQEQEPEPDFDETLEILKIKDRIIRYSTSFGKYLGVFMNRIEDIDNMDIDQLKKLIREIEIAVSARTSGNMVRIYYHNTINAIEKLAPIAGFNLQGLSQVLLENAQIDECIEELNIKYDIMRHVRPEMRLAFITLNAVLAVNSQNKKMETIAKVVNTPLNPEHVEAFADL